jgi:hypothetical protein
MEVAQDTRRNFVSVLMNPWVLLPHCLEVMSQSFNQLLASKNYDNFLNQIQRQIQINKEKYWSSNNLTKKQPRI